jgi:hypothetical protein
MALAFALPLVSRIVAGAVGLPLAPLSITAVFALILRRALRVAVDGAERAPFEADFQIRLSLALKQ